MSDAAADEPSVLIIKPSSLGDIVHTLPAVALLKKSKPRSHIAWLINTDWAPVLEDNPYVDEVIIFPRRRFRGVRGLPAMAVWANAMRKRQFDLVLDFQGLLRTGLVSRLFGGADVRGLSDAREGARFFYKRTVRVAKDQHAVERYLQLVADLGIDTRRPLEFALPPGKRPAHFSTSGPYLLLHPFARGPAKSMLKADVVSFCRELMPIPIVLAGRSDKHVDLPRNCINMLNKTTLAELIWLIRNAQFVVSVDSGPAHLAAAVGDNLISIHRWSDPHLVGPYNPLAWVWKDGALFQMRDIDEPGGDARARADYLSDLTEFVRKKFAPAAVGRKPAQA